MILDRFANIAIYRGLGEGFDKAIQFLTNTDVFALPLGNVEIAGRAVYAFVKETLLETENEAWEAHERYADIQMILAGSERMGFAPFNGQEAKKAYDAQKDIGFYKVSAGSELLLSAGEFAVFLPGELHRPDCPANGAGVSRKMVVKIQMAG